ncbi:P antigen family member 4 [Hippopotamus amphibius kiboko]|uniref:P antigen family member 4 n=1 Tax=Hippopotamus amphibius kiboko TaxID=575201 RepID=UPI002595F444|nr:P antigen family member 4 [Hippopotamus amphibius kiboko]
MSARVRSRSRGRGDGQESSDTAERVKLGGKKSPQKEPPTENVDIEPGQEKEGGTSVIQGASQEMGLEKTVGERRDGTDVKGEIPPNLLPAKIPEAVFVGPLVLLPTASRSQHSSAPQTHGRSLPPRVAPQVEAASLPLPPAA